MILSIIAKFEMATFFAFLFEMCRQCTSMLIFLDLTKARVSFFVSNVKRIKFAISSFTMIEEMSSGQLLCRLYQTSCSIKNTVAKIYLFLVLCYVLYTVSIQNDSLYLLNDY